MREQARPDWAQLDRIINRKGWRIVLFLRMGGVPYNVSNYLFSVTSIDVCSTFSGGCPRCR